MLKINNLDRLNGLAESLNNGKIFQKINFSTGKIPKVTAKACNKLCPYSKLVVLYGHRGFKLWGEALTAELKSNRLQPINVILSRKEFLASKDELSLTLPENARLIVTVDGEHYASSQELAGELNLACVLGVQSLPDKIFCKAKPQSTEIIFSEDLSFSPSEVYEKIVGKIVSLLDIKLKQFLRLSKQNVELEYKFIQALDLALSVYDEHKANYIELLLQYFISLEIMQTALEHYPQALDLKSALCLIKLVATNLDKEFFFAPNYIERAKAVSESYEISYLQALEFFKAQLERQELFKHRLGDIKKGLCALAKIYVQRFPQIINAYKALGGQVKNDDKTNEELLKTVKYSGDLSYRNNIASLLREIGCLA